MAEKLKYRIFAEWNRDGKLEKVGTERYDPDKVSVVAIHEQEQYINEDGKKKWKPPVKKFEHIFIKDEEPDPMGRDPKIMFDDEDGLYQTSPGEALAINAVITDPDGNDTIKEVVWLQMMGPACPFDIVPDSNNRSIIIQPALEGDYAFSVTVTDDTDRVATRIANVQVRIQVPVCPAGQHPGPDGQCVPDEPGPTPGPEEKWIPVVAGFGDSNSNSRSSQTFQNIKKLDCDVSALGDYEYDGNFDDFKSIYIIKDKTKYKLRGNHDTADSESAAIESANNAYWGWKSGQPATEKVKIGNIGLVAIDTQYSVNDQKQFVETALLDFKSDPDVVFIVCGAHKPIYCSTSKHGEEKGFRDALQPLFDKYGVDVVFSGHNHNTGVSYPLVTGKVKKFELNSAGEYDFSKVHGQIYVQSGNCGESLYKIDSNPDYIKWSNDKDYGFVVLQQSQNNPRRMKISFMANSGQELHSVVIDKTGQSTPPQNPVFETDDESIAGNVNEDVTMTVQAKDPTNPQEESMKNLVWAQMAGPVAAVLNISQDTGNATFNTAVAGNYAFRVTATGSTGLVSKIDLAVLIRDTVTPPGSKVIWSSRRDTLLHDGKIRTITKEGNIGPGGLGVECRASGNPRIVVNADGTFSLVCDDGHGRIYVYALHYNSRLELKCRLSPSVDNISLKTRSEHNEEGPCEKRFGGFGDANDRDTMDFKTEICHNTHENGKTIDFNPNLQSEKWYGLAFECKDSEDGKEVLFEGFIDYNDGKGWQSKGKHKHSSPKPYYLDKAAFAKQSYFWIRLNGAGKIDLDDVVLIDLDQ